MRNLLRREIRTPPEELAAAQARSAERLAQIFSKDRPRAEAPEAEIELGAGAEAPEDEEEAALGTMAALEAGAGAPGIGAEDWDVVAPVAGVLLAPEVEAPDVSAEGWDEVAPVAGESLAPEAWAEVAPEVVSETWAEVPPEAEADVPSADPVVVEAVVEADVAPAVPPRIEVESRSVALVVVAPHAADEQGPIGDAVPKVEESVVKSAAQRAPSPARAAARAKPDAAAPVAQSPAAKARPATPVARAKPGAAAPAAQTPAAKARAAMPAAQTPAAKARAAKARAAKARAAMPAAQTPAAKARAAKARAATPAPPARPDAAAPAAPTPVAKARAATPAPPARPDAAAPVAPAKPAVKARPATPVARARPDAAAPVAPAKPAVKARPATPARAARRPVTPARRKGAAPAPVACPYCAGLLDPPPTASRRCPHCRQRVVVKRAEGRTIYLTEAAVPVFEAQRRRAASSPRLTRERDRWLQLATAAGASDKRLQRVVAAQVSDEVVEAARSLYLGTVDRTVRTAKHDRRWEDAARLRREQALALHRLARRALPPPDDVVAIYRDGVASELRGVAEIARTAELAGASCCEACKADDGKSLRIATELRSPRLPHAGCPKGLCRCSWHLASRDVEALRRYVRSHSRSKSARSVEHSPAG